MRLRCPHCSRHVLIARSSQTELFLCPCCRHPFRVTLTVPNRTLRVAVDVSTSVVPHQVAMHRELMRLRHRSPESEPRQMLIYTFHRLLVPFPCEQLCYCGAAMVLPTLRDLRGRVSAGSAVLDSLYELLSEAGSSPAGAEDIVLLTDGHDRGSRRHPEEVRRKIKQVGTHTRIHILVFVDADDDRLLMTLMGKLASTHVLWSFFTSRSASVAREILFFSGLNSTVHRRGRASCRN